jgi:hypothetical protein
VPERSVRSAVAEMLTARAGNSRTFFEGKIICLTAY